MKKSRPCELITKLLTKFSQANPKLLLSMCESMLVPHATFSPVSVSHSLTYLSYAALKNCDPLLLKLMSRTAFPWPEESRRDRWFTDRHWSPCSCFYGQNTLCPRGIRCCDHINGARTLSDTHPWKFVDTAACHKLPRAVGVKSILSQSSLCRHFRLNWPRA